MARTKFLLLGLILVLAACTAIRPISAAEDLVDQISVNISLGNIEVVAGQSYHNGVQFSGNYWGVISLIDVTVSCSNLPAGAACSTTPSPLPGPFDNPSSFEFILSTSPSTLPGIYTIQLTVYFTEYIAPEMIQPVFLSRGDSLGPESISIQQTPLSVSAPFTLIVDPAPPIPEFPLGLPLLAVFMIVGYAVIRRKTVLKQR